jgi:hypothetical protein
MNPLFILIGTVFLLGITAFLNFIAPISERKRNRVLFVLLPVMAGVLTYGLNFAAAQMVYRDSLSATRTTTIESAVIAENIKHQRSGIPGFGSDYAKRVQYGRQGSSVTENGYKVDITNGFDGSYTATVSKDGDTIKTITDYDSYLGFTSGKSWVTNYPMLPVWLLR